MSNIAIDQETLELLIDLADLVPRGRLSDWQRGTGYNTAQITGRVKLVTDQLGRDPIFDEEDFSS